MDKRTHRTHGRTHARTDARTHGRTWATLNALPHSSNGGGIKNLTDIYCRSGHLMSGVVRKPAFGICENKGANQLRGNREADQRLCFRYTDSKIPLLPKSEISSLSPSSVTVKLGLCQTRSETPKTSFLTTRLKCHNLFVQLF